MVFALCFVAAIALAVLTFLGRIAVEMGPLGAFTLPVGLAVGGLLLATVVQFTIDGVRRTALFRDASDGQLPPAVSSNPDALGET